MGCTQPKPKPVSNLKPEVQSPAPLPPSEPAPVPKISYEEAEKRRNELRNNLEEGRCNPPRIVLPKIQPIETD